MSYKKFNYLHFSKRLYEATYNFVFLMDEPYSMVRIENTQSYSSKVYFPINNKRIDWNTKSHSFPAGLKEAAEIELRKIYLTAFS